ncbi:hypothetical protein [Tautonia plasticadhaerens]|uniref:Uncharacterized protein n=1 Tax=Tautonia plasticadhaerens TaxID=2527974 RepID=A0A518H6T8_9BACT|nr:hypothetical protein [Tautonia plasticadhaerens]QDV36562.1 hypothetical protein ElP_44900 [Tautonia plasticadhaerens]
MRLAPATPRLWHLMAFVAAVAGVFAIIRQIGPGPSMFIGIGLFPGVLAWLASRRRRKAAAVAFAASVGLAAAPIILLCAYWLNIAGVALAVLWAILTVPPTIGFGIAWASEFRQEGGPGWRASVPPWTLVLASAALLISMIPTLWPLRLAFLASRPSLDRLADRVAAGETLVRPARAGLYRIVASRLEPRSGSVALLTDDHLAGGSGFVRLSTRLPQHSPMSNLNFNVHLGRRWRYQDED